MNSLYTFGCSFTAGQDMISKNNQYYQLKKRYSKLLSNELNFREKNLSECGASNFWIFRRVMRKLKSLMRHKNNIVVIQWTSPYRYELPTRIDDVYFSLPYLDFTIPELGTPDGSEINPLIKEYENLSKDFIAKSYNEKWLLESSYNLQFTLYHTLENLGIKHIHLFGWPSIVNDLVKLDKFLDKPFINVTTTEKAETLRHPNEKENFNLKERLMNKIIDLNYMEKQE
tara:strand:- start:3559 stop:4242 length:684 start_codon:yes stop_codon:yes gene_type:complete